MKLLNGKELAGYIQQRQIGQVRALRQGHEIVPKLAIIRTNPDPVVDSYTIDQSEALTLIEKLNTDPSVHGIIVQIPIPDPSQTTEILNAVTVDKDVDGLSENATFDAPTPLAITWLLAGYNVDLRGKVLTIVGNGRLVGKPLAKLWRESNLEVNVVDKSVPNLAEVTVETDVLVCATGVPALIKADMIKPNAVIVDAGVATDSNGLIGDVAADVRELPDITITPEKGGVGPLTVCALFDNVIRAANKKE